ncbi:Uncharacterised protein [Legionella hackeliae]|nr:Uncharacterised protein [Legionella hackeliae]
MHKIYSIKSHEKAFPKVAKPILQLNFDKDFITIKQCHYEQPK